MNTTAHTPVSVVIITKNEEDNIRECLKSVTWADEVVIVDSGSTDATCSIAKDLGAKVIHNDWPGYGPQKLFATKQARHDWILSLDADERISQTLANNITKELMAPKLQAYALKRLHYLLGKPVRYGDCMNDWVLRLFNKQKAAFNEVMVHEAVGTQGEVGRINGHIHHYTAPSLGIFIEKLNHYTDLQAANLISKDAYIGWVHVTFVPFWRFFRSFVLKCGFLDGIPGLVYACTAALTSFLKHAKTMDQTRPDKASK